MQLHSHCNSSSQVLLCARTWPFEPIAEYLGQALRGSLNADTFREFHWLPLVPGCPDYGGGTIKFACSVLENLPSWSATDYYFKREAMRDKDGKRRSDADLYGLSKNYEHSLTSIETCIRSLRPLTPEANPAIIHWCAITRQHFKNALTDDEIIEFGGFQVMTTPKPFGDLTSNLRRFIFRIPHPEHLMRWTSQTMLADTCSRLRRLARDYAVGPVNSDPLKRSMRLFENREDSGQGISDEDRLDLEKSLGTTREGHYQVMPQDIKIESDITQANNSIALTGHQLALRDVLQSLLTKTLRPMHQAWGPTRGQEAKDKNTTMEQP